MSCPDPVHAMFGRLIAAEARSTRRMAAADVDELLGVVGLDTEALRTWARHVERNAIPESSLGAAFCGGFLLALELRDGESLEAPS